MHVDDEMEYNYNKNGKNSKMRWLYEPERKHTAEAAFPDKE